jgi:hypothetical protein
MHHEAPSGRLVCYKQAVLFPLLVASLLSTASPQAGRVLVMDLEAIGVPVDEASAATRVVAAAAADVDGVVVMSAAELRRLAELEGTKATAGCSDDANCLADIAGALGAERVIFGSLSRLGSTTTVVLSLYTSATQRAERRSFDVVDMNGLSVLLRSNTASLLAGTPSSGDDGAPPDPSAGPISAGVVPLIAGVSVLVLGGGTAIVSEAMVQDPAENGALKGTMQPVGLVGVGAAIVGAAVSIVGVVMMFGGE